MAHALIKHTITFSDHFSKILDLTESQIQQLDNLELEYYREKMFGDDLEFNQEKWWYKYRRNLVSNLTKEQRKALKAYRKNRKVKKENEKEQQIQAGTLHLKKQLKDIDLSKEELQKVARIQVETIEWVLQKTGDDPQSITKDRNAYFLEKLGEVLSPEKIKAYQAGIKTQPLSKESIEEKNKHNLIRTTKLRYPEMYLTDDQAIKIGEFDRQFSRKDENGEYLSFWEELDLEKNLMKNTLTEKQYQLQSLRFQEKVEAQLQSLKEDNERHINLIEREENQKNYFLKHHMPLSCQLRAELEENLTKHEKQFIQDLRDAHFKANREVFINAKTKHYRHYRNYCPNILHLNKIQYLHQILMPAGFYVGHRFPEIQETIRKEILQQILDMGERFEKNNKQIKTFMMQNYESTGGKYGGHIYVTRADPDVTMRTSILSMLFLETCVEKNIANMERARLLMEEG